MAFLKQGLGSSISLSEITVPLLTGQERRHSATFTVIRSAQSKGLDKTAEPF
ncbi:MAG: hypothetical protein AAGA01_13595 [Cyanobacteria bacterium P01_E01_bin.43]